MRAIEAPRIATAILLVATSTAIAAPAVTLTPAGGHPKTVTQVTGTGFTPNEAVDIYLDATDELLEVTNSLGKFGPDKLKIPAKAEPGSHWITAVGRNNGDAAHGAFIVSTAWASYGFNELGRRRNPYENLIDASNVGSLDLAWSAATGSNVFSSPAVYSVGSGYNPYIFVGSDDAKLYAFDAAGNFKWSVTTGGPIDSSPAIGPNAIVYVGSNDHKLYAVKAATGAPAWAAPATTGGIITSSPTVANGIVYVGSGDGKLYAFNAATGAAAWAAPATTGGIHYSSPTVADGIVYIGSTDHNLYAFNAATGASAFTVAEGGIIDAKPAVAGGVVYFTSEEGRIYAIKRQNGGPAWPAPVIASSSIYSSPAVAGGVVYVASYNTFYALNAVNGSTLWTSPITGGGFAFSSPAVANGVVYVGNEIDDKLYMFNATGCGASTCAPLWAVVPGFTIESSPAISDGMVFVGSNDNNLHALALDAGNNPAYKHRKTEPPSYASLHPDFRLKPVKH